MSQEARIAASATITAVNIKGASVSNEFNAVRALNFDYFKGMLSVDDTEQGLFYFPLTPVTTVTITVAGSVTTIVIS